MVFSTDCELRNWTVFNSSIHGGGMQYIDSLCVNLLYFPAASTEDRTFNLPNDSRVSVRLQAIREK